MKKAVSIFLFLCVVLAVILALTACGNNSNTRQAIHASSSSLGYIFGSIGDAFEITDDTIRQELLEIIAVSKQQGSLEPFDGGFWATSFRHSWDFIIDDIIYSFEIQHRMLIIFHPEENTHEYYSMMHNLLDFERALEIHRQHIK